MSYTDDGVKAKLSALNETQDSIVAVAQWVMFHRRYADRTAMTWLQKVKDSGSNKRLNLIYLANEVAQQSRARKKDDFIIAFSPIIAEATAIAYAGAPYEIQQKLRRSIEIWRQRSIFDSSIQEAVEARVDELDKTRSSGRKGLLGGSLSSSSSAPPELQPLVSLQIAVTKATATTTNASQTANTEYDKLTDPSKAVPTPPVHAARLSALLKSLASAEGAVNESIKARKALLAAMEKLVETNKASLTKEESQQFELTSRKTTIEAKKREVEDGIMRGLSAEEASQNHASLARETKVNGKGTPHTDTGSVEPERPQPEELTPPPVESFTPIGSPHSGAQAVVPPDASPQHQVDADARGPSTLPPFQPATYRGTAGITKHAEYASNTATGPTRAHSGGPGGAGPAKKRRLDDDYTGFGSGDAMADLDDDVAELLRAESGGS